MENVKADNNQLILMTINGFVCIAVDLVNEWIGRGGSIKMQFQFGRDDSS